MSEERYNSTVDEIKKIFLFLTEQEPSPDDEIEARDKLIDLFKNLKNIDSHLEFSSLIEEIIDELNDWDTLDLWFKEVKDLVSKVRKIVNLDEESSALEFEKKIEGEKQHQGDNKQSSPEVDIAEIVAQVADQFKGQIENLKGQIDQLQGELEKKSEALLKNQEDLDEESDIQDETFATIEEYSLESEPDKNEPVGLDSEPIDGTFKLAPPKIKIPPLKEPQIAPEIESEESITQKEEPELTPVPKMGAKASEPPKSPISSSHPKNGLSEIPKLTTSSKPKTEVLEVPENKGTGGEALAEPAKRTKKFKISSEVIETPDLTSIGTNTSSKAPNLTPIPELQPSKPLSEVNELKSFLENTGRVEISPGPSEEPAKPLTDISTLESFLNNPETKETEPIPAGTIFATEEKPKKLQVIPEVLVSKEEESITSEEPFLEPEKAKKIKINSEITETTENEDSSNEEVNSLPFTFKKPSVKIEDIKDDSLQTSSSDLFNVFSSVGGEIFDKSETPPEQIEVSTDKDKKKKKEDKKLSKKEAKKAAKKSPKKEAPEPAIFDHPKQKVEPKEPDILSLDINKLPKDKDSLYQDLIALEGKRYSLERSLKQLQQDLVEKTVDEHEFENRSNDLKAKMRKISKSINSIRKSIAKLK